MALTLSVEDSFTDTAFTALASHVISPTPNGFSWLDTVPGITIDSAGTGLRNGGTSELSADLTDDQAIELKVLTTDNDWLLYIRFDWNAGNINAFRLQNDGANLVLRSIDNGIASSTLASAAYTQAANDEIYFEVIGTNITVKVNGSTSFTYGSATEHSSGTGCIFYGHSADGWATNFKAYEETAGGAGFLLVKN